MSKENLIDVFVDGLDFDPLVTLADILDVTVDPPPLDDMWPDWQNELAEDVCKAMGEVIESITEHPDVQRLIGQVAELQIKSHELQDENERVKPLTEARFNDWLIAKGQIRELQAENERLKKAIKHLSLGEYTDALSEGCDANGAFDCLCEAVRNWKDEVLKGNQ